MSSTIEVPSAIEAKHRHSIILLGMYDYRLYSTFYFVENGLSTSGRISILHN